MRRAPLTDWQARAKGHTQKETPRAQVHSPFRSPLATDRFGLSCTTAARRPMSYDHWNCPAELMLKSPGSAGAAPPAAGASNIPAAGAPNIPAAGAPNIAPKAGVASGAGIASGAAGGGDAFTPAPFSASGLIATIAAGTFLFMSGLLTKAESRFQWASLVVTLSELRSPNL